MAKRYGRKVDANQKEFVRDLRSVGLDFKDTHDLGRGFPDGVVGLGGFNFLVELKASRAEVLTAAEKEWHKSYGGMVIVTHSAEDFLNQVCGWFEYTCNPSEVKQEFVDALAELQKQGMEP